MTLPAQDQAARDANRVQPTNRPTGGGGNVRALQQALAAAGFDPGPIDGIFGSLTRAAMQQYQQANGLPVTDRFDDATITALTGGETEGAGASTTPAPSTTSVPPPTFGSDINAAPVTIADITIPAGAQLLRVNNGDGSRDYFLVYDLGFGVEVAFSVGDQERYQDLFPSGEASFDSVETVTEAQFRNSDLFRFQAGDVSEVQGATESLGTQIANQLALLGLEDLPDSVRDDGEVMRILVQATQEGWSPERTNQELSNTDWFQQRYPAFETVKAAAGTQTITDTVSTYKTLEDEMRTVLRQYRGPDADTSTGTIGELLGAGWNPSEVGEVLQGEQLLRRNPGFLGELNSILLASGLEPVDEGGFLDIVQGRAPTDVFEAINDTLRSIQLAEEGIALDAEIAALLGEGDSTGVVDDTGTFSTLAREAAAKVFRNVGALRTSQFGLSRNDILAAVFDDPDLTDKSVSDVERILSQLERERQAASSGFSGASSFIDPRGRLRIQGFGATQ